MMFAGGCNVAGGISIQIMVIKSLTFKARSGTQYF